MFDLTRKSIMRKKYTNISLGRRQTKVTFLVERLLNTKSWRQNRSATNTTTSGCNGNEKCIRGWREKNILSCCEEGMLRVTRKAAVYINTTRSLDTKMEAQDWVLMRGIVTTSQPDSRTNILVTWVRQVSVGLSRECLKSTKQRRIKTGSTKKATRKILKQKQKRSHKIHVDWLKGTIADCFKFNTETKVGGECFRD